jgi:hypothetical protein
MEGKLKDMTKQYKLYSDKRYHLGGQYLDLRTILTVFFEKWGWTYQIDSSGSGEGRKAYFCEHYNGRKI